VDILYEELENNLPNNFLKEKEYFTGNHIFLPVKSEENENEGAARIPAKIENDIFDEFFPPG